MVYVGGEVVGHIGERECDTLMGEEWCMLVRWIVGHADDEELGHAGGTECDMLMRVGT